jgi:hypothetical protein
LKYAAADGLLVYFQSLWSGIVRTGYKHLLNLLAQRAIDSIALYFWRGCRVIISGKLIAG